MLVQQLVSQKRLLRCTLQTISLDLTCTGTTRLTVSPGGFSHEFAVIEDFAYPVLLGANFLTRVGAVIDLKRGVVSIATDSPNEVVHLPVRRVFSQAESCPGELVNISTQPQPRTLVISRGRDSQDDEEACPDLILVEEDRHGPSVNDQRLRAQVTINKKLTGKQVEQLNSLFEEFKDVFAENDDDLGHTNVAEHTIDTGRSKPTNRPPHRTSPAERQVIADHVADMKRRGIVEDSESPWASPVIPAGKAARQTVDSWFCVNYWHVNDVTKKDRYPLPRIDDALSILWRQSILYLPCLQSGFWQVPISEEDREKTAFMTPDGLFQFTVMLFGLCNAPATFQRTMDHVVAGLQWITCLVYLDDVLVYSHGGH